MKNLLILAFAITFSVPLTAQQWAFGIGTGPFVFGDFSRRDSTISNDESTVHVHTSISAGTRAGLIVDGERLLNDRLSLRLSGTATRAPLSIRTKSGKDDGVSLDIGHLSVTTVALAVVFRFNSGGSFRPYLLAGPAWARYSMHDAPEGAEPLFTGTRTRPGAEAGGGLEWWWRRNIGVRGELTDLLTGSPLRRSDFNNPPPSLELRKPHNVHTSAALVVRF